MSTDRLHRPRHHGRPDGRPPVEGRPRRRRRTTARRSGTEPLVEAGGTRGDLDRRGGQRGRRRHHDGPGLPRRRGGRSRRGRHLRQRAAGRARHRHLLDPARRRRRAGRGRHASAASGCSTPRSAAARPARSRPPCRSWSAARRPTSTRPSRSSTRSARRSSTSARAASGQTVKAANQLIVGRQHRAGRRGDRLPRGVRRRHRGRARGARRRPGRPHGAGPQGRRACSAGKFEPGFRIDLHHKDMGIVTSRGPRGRRRHPARRRRSPS